MLEEYMGNRLNCSECKFCPKMNLSNGDKHYSPCKMIDHNKIRLYTQIFNGYDGSIHTCHICKYYEPAIWNISSQKEWKGIESYIEFMNKDFYETPKYLECNKIRDTIYITLCIGSIDCYGEFQYHVSLYDWLTGNAIKDSEIKYISKYKIERTKGNKPKGLILINQNGIDDISDFLK